MAFGEVTRQANSPAAWPSGIGGTANVIWHCDSDADDVYELLTSDFSVDRQANSPVDLPSGIGGDSSTIWHCDTRNDDVWELSTTDFSTVRTDNSPATIPSGIGGDSNTIWHCDQDTELVYELSTTDFSTVRSAASPYTVPSGIGGDANTIWYCSSDDDQVYELSTTDFSTIRKAISTSAIPFGIGGDSSTIWCCDAVFLDVHELDIGIIEMTATSAAAFSTTGSLTRGIIELMTATSAVASSTTASLTRGRTESLTATSAIASSTTASLTRGKTEALTATASIVSSTSGFLTLLWSLSGTAEAATSTLGFLTLLWSLSGTAEAAISTQASLTRGRIEVLTATSTYITTTSAFLSTVKIFTYCLKIYNTSDVKVAEIASDIQNVTISALEFELLQSGGCGSFSFTLAEPYTQATIDRDYRVDIHCFGSADPWYSGKIINKPVAGTDKEQTYSGWGYFEELEKKLINTSIAPAQNIKAAVETLLDTFIIPYTSILKDVSLVDSVAGHTLVATIDVMDEEARWIFDRLREIAVGYKFGVRADRKFYFQVVDSSIQQYWHVGKHLNEFLPEEDASELVKKVIAAPDSQIFSDGYELRVISEAGDYAGLYEKRFSVPEIISPFSETNIASGKSVSTSPTGTGASNITDDDYSTLWASGTNQASGHYIEIDLGEDFDNIARIIIDSIHDNAKEFVAQSIKIEIKPDGGSYSTILQTDKGIGWKPAITFRPTTGRYIKLSLTQAGDVEWKVGEVEVNQLDLADVQRWTDGQLALYESVLKRATARIENVTSLISPTGKARIFDTDGTKIDDYQIVACLYSLSANSKLAVEFELGVEERGPADHLKDLERRIREAELTGVRRAENLSLAKGLQLGAIPSTYIGPKSIQTPHLEVDSLWARHYHELRNTYVFSDQDSLDDSKSFEMDFEIVSEMTAIQTVKLSFRIREFRAYAVGVPSGGGHTTPAGGGATSGATGSASGGGATSGATGSASGGGHTTPAGGGHTTPSGGGHTSGSRTHGHPVNCGIQTANHHHQIQVTTTGASVHELSYEDGAHSTHAAQTGYMTTGNITANHQHVVSISASGSHDHAVYDHQHSVSNHQHAVSNHTHPNHQHSTPNHTHPNHQHSTPDHQHTVSNHVHSLTFGIYEDSQSPTIHYHIDNGAGYGGASSNYTTDQLDLVITGSISGAGFKRIKFDTNARCRISGWVLIKLDLTA